VTAAAVPILCQIREQLVALAHDVRALREDLRSLRAERPAGLSERRRLFGEVIANLHARGVIPAGADLYALADRAECNADAIAIDRAGNIVARAPRVAEFPVSSFQPHPQP
jgi:hypothetical protein